MKVLLLLVVMLALPFAALGTLLIVGAPVIPNVLVFVAAFTVLAKVRVARR